MHFFKLALLAMLPPLLAACSTDIPNLTADKEAAAATSAADPGHGTTEATSPAASIQVYVSADEDFGQTPHTVRLTAEVKPGTGRPPFTFIWDFGDATEFKREPSVTHVYNDAGNYRASVKVVDASGDKDQDYVDVWILPPVTDEQLHDAMARVQQMKMPSGDEIQLDLQKRLQESLTATSGESTGNAPATR